MIELEAGIEDQEVAEFLQRVARSARNPAPALHDIGEHLVETTKQRFVDSEAPDGSPWAPNRPSTLTQYLGRFTGLYKKSGGLNKKGRTRLANKKPLIGETRALATTIYYRVEPGGLRVGSPEEYSATQQLGAEKGAFGRTRRGVPIPWGDIQAREYLGFSDNDWKAVRRILKNFLLGP